MAIDTVTSTMYGFVYGMGAMTFIINPIGGAILLGVTSIPVVSYNISMYYINKETKEHRERVNTARAAREASRIEESRYNMSVRESLEAEEFRFARYSRESEEAKKIKDNLTQFKKEFMPSAPIEKCIICLNSINEEYIRLECDHSFHKDCIEKWALVNPSCALCRKKY